MKIENHSASFILEGSHAFLAGGDGALRSSSEQWPLHTGAQVKGNLWAGL